MLFSIVLSIHIITLFSIFLITFFWSILNPSINHLNCWGVISLTSSDVLGHWKAPFSSLLYIKRNPSHSQKRTFILSFLPPQNKNSEFSNGSSLKFCTTIAANPSMDFLISVLPQAIYIFKSSGNLILIDYLPIKFSTKANVFGSAPLKISISVPFERRIAQVP